MPVPSTAVPLAVPMAAACVEVGGGGVQTVLLSPGSAPVVLDGAHAPAGLPVLVAVPGLVHAGRVVIASNLGWVDVDPAEQLGLDRHASLVLNDAEAAALGESALRGRADLVHVGLGTGVGGAVVRDGAVVGANLLGHRSPWADAARSLPPFGDVLCPCGQVGCLETVAAGWALPDPLPADAVPALAAAIAAAVEDEPLATPRLVVVAGGLARRHPAVVAAVAAALPDRVVEPSAAPDGAKSAAAWGLVVAHAEAHGAVA